MPAWELATQFISIDSGKQFGTTVDPSRLWTIKGKDGKTGWDDLGKLAAEGWELVSVTPISIGGGTTFLLYTFKRPKP